MFRNNDEVQNKKKDHYVNDANTVEVTKPFLDTSVSAEKNSIASLNKGDTFSKVEQAYNPTLSQKFFDRFVYYTVEYPAYVYNVYVYESNWLKYLRGSEFLNEIIAIETRRCYPKEMPNFYCINKNVPGMLEQHFAYPVRPLHRRHVRINLLSYNRVRLDGRFKMAEVKLNKEPAESIARLADLVRDRVSPDSKFESILLRIIDSTYYEFVVRPMIKVALDSYALYDAKVIKSNAVQYIYNFAREQNSHLLRNDFSSRLEAAKSKNYSYMEFVGNLIFSTLFWSCITVCVLMAILAAFNANTNLVLSAGPYIKKLNSLVDSDTSSFKEIKVTLFLVSFTLLSALFIPTFLVFSDQSVKSDLISAATFASLLVLTPLLTLVFLGNLFLTYIKGTDFKNSFVMNYFFDLMAMISFFSRYLLQLVRIMLALSVFYLLHEYLFSDIISFMHTNNFDDSVRESHMIRAGFVIIRVLYELSDFLSILIIQTIAFLTVLFVLFSFLFTTVVDKNYEEFMSEKREDLKKFLRK